MSYTPSVVSFYNANQSGESLEYTFNRPPEVLQDDSCMVKLIGRQSLYVLVWGRMLFVIKRINLSESEEELIGEESLGKSSTGCYSILETVDVRFKPDLSLMLNEHTLMLLRHDGVVRVAGLGVYSKLLQRGSMLEAEEFFMDQNSGFKSSANIFMKNLGNKITRLSDDSLVVIDKGDFIKIKTVETDELVQQCINRGEWHQAI